MKRILFDSLLFVLLVIGFTVAIIALFNVGNNKEKKLAPNPQIKAFAATVQIKTYETCSQLGRHNIVSTDPAYSSHLDRDKDGIACEK